MKYLFFSVLICLGCISKDKEEKYKITSREEKILCEAIGKIPDTTQLRFQVLFDQWSKHWKNGILIFSSNTYDVMKMKEYPELVAMGDTIIPLVIEKLLYRSNFWSVHLYNALQKDVRLKGHNDLDVHGGVHKTIQLWLNNSSQKKLQAFDL
ncbi:MAG: hypothetical protein LBQ60_18615 [Bacteroidales bacterium]|jgi:hypothetical protein|nr:hypothetical protein [Bacteroidales bacterium]